jgi:hypothetical protein
MDWRACAGASVDAGDGSAAFEAACVAAPDPTGGGLGDTDCDRAFATCEGFFFDRPLRPFRLIAVCFSVPAVASSLDAAPPDSDARRTSFPSLASRES